MLVKGAFLKILLTIFILMIAIPPRTHAKDWTKIKCTADVKELATQLLEVELAGRQLHKKSPCLSEKKFKYVSAAHSPRQEEPLSVDRYIGKNYQIKILNVKPSELGTYKIKFSISDDNKFKFKGDFSIIILHDPKVSSSFPCAGILVFPKLTMIRKECS